MKRSSGLSSSSGLRSRCSCRAARGWVRRPRLAEVLYVRVQLSDMGGERKSRNSGGLQLTAKVRVQVACVFDHHRSRSLGFASSDLVVLYHTHDMLIPAG